MATLSDIKSYDWQISLTGAGNIEQGYNDVAQCIDVILRTPKGSDPLRPFFGSDVYNYVDAPVNIAIPNIKKEIINAISLWEPRVQIVSITHILQVENIQFFINYKVVDDDQQLVQQILIGKGGILTTDVPPSQLVLQALLPAGWPGKQLLLAFTLNGSPAAPAPPALGFANPTILLAWVTANWGFYARFYLLPDRLVAFLRPGIANTATLAITTSNLLRVAVPFPPLTPGQQYQLVLNSITDIAGTTTGPVTAPAQPTMAAVLAWVNANLNYSSAVTWAVENTITGGDFDASDFDTTDFNTQNIQYDLVAYTAAHTAIDFEINAV